MNKISVKILLSTNIWYIWIKIKIMAKNTSILGDYFDDFINRQIKE